MTSEDLSKLTVPALRKLAAERNIKGRSTMAKPALIEALSALQAQNERDIVVDSFIATGVAPYDVVMDGEKLLLSEFKTIDLGGTWEPTGIDNRATGVDTSAMDRIDSLPDVTVTVTMAKPTGDELAKTIGRMMATFATRATARYIRDGRKHLTPRQRRRINHKTNAYMKRAFLDA